MFKFHLEECCALSPFQAPAELRHKLSSDYISPPILSVSFQLMCPLTQSGSPVGEYRHMDVQLIDLWVFLYFTLSFHLLIFPFFLHLFLFDFLLFWFRENLFFPKICFALLATVLAFPNPRDCHQISAGWDWGCCDEHSCTRLQDHGSQPKIPSHLLVVAFETTLVPWFFLVFMSW